MGASLRPIATWAFTLALALSTWTWTATVAHAAPAAKTPGKAGVTHGKKKAKPPEAVTAPTTADESAGESAKDAKDAKDKAEAQPGVVGGGPQEESKAKARTAAPVEAPRDRAEQDRNGTTLTGPPDEPKLEPKPNPEALAVGAPTNVDEASPEGGKLQVHPYFLVTGGLKVDVVKELPGKVKNDRISTFALGRIGFRARWLDFISAESEFMASGGVSLHGTSAYEGQAAMQVRQQTVRLHKYGARLEVGRIIDEASVDYFSAHVSETFIQDTATRDALLFSGFNLGNGMRASYEIVPGLRAAFTFNAGNPVSNTASLLIGGGYPPFDRFYTQPYQQVNQSAQNFPDDNFHEMVFTPSVLLDTEFIDAKVAIQRFDVNTNTSSDQDDHITGYNVRGTARVKLFGRSLIPYASSAYTLNDTLVPTNLAKRAPEHYQAVNLGGGVDINIQRRFKCSHDCADGFGLQYQQVQFQIGDGLVTTQRYVNVGSTLWLAPNVSVGLRFALWNKEAEQPVLPAGIAAGQTKPAVDTEGERSVIAALRFIMP